MYSTAAGAAGSSGNGTVTISAAGTLPSYYATPNQYYTGSGSYITSASNPSGLHCSTDATFEGDIKWKGRSLEKLLESIESRLAIVSNPDPEKLEKFAALKKAYDNYKLLEKLCNEGNDADDHTR